MNLLDVLAEATLRPLYRPRSEKTSGRGTSASFHKFSSVFCFFLLLLFFCGRSPLGSSSRGRLVLALWKLCRVIAAQGKMRLERNAKLYGNQNLAQVIVVCDLSFILRTLPPASSAQRSYWTQTLAPNELLNCKNNMNILSMKTFLKTLPHDDNKPIFLYHKLFHVKQKNQSAVGELNELQLSERHGGRYAKRATSSLGNRGPTKGFLKEDTSRAWI